MTYQEIYQSVWGVFHKMQIQNFTKNKQILISFNFFDKLTKTIQTQKHISNLLSNKLISGNLLQRSQIQVYQ